MGMWFVIGGLVGWRLFEQLGSSSTAIRSPAQDGRKVLIPPAHPLGVIQGKPGFTGSSSLGIQLSSLLVFFVRFLGISLALGLSAIGGQGALLTGESPDACLVCFIAQLEGLLLELLDLGGGGFVCHR